MSSKKNNRDSYVVSSRQETAKAALPYVGGFMLAIFIWLGWFFTYTESVEGIDTNTVMFGMLIIIIIVEVPIIVLKSYLAYKNKIIKMRPKSSYSLGKIEDFLKEVEHYRNGNYEYETIKNEEDIIESHERGKMIIFTAKPLAEKILIWIGIFISVFVIVIIGVIALILSLELETLLFILSISHSVALIIGSIFIIPNLVKLKRLKRSFFILDPKGIVYSQKWGGIRAYSWKELEIKMYHVKTTMKSFGMTMALSESSQLNIILPNEAVLKFKLEEYTHNEFLSIENFMQALEGKENIPTSYKHFLISKADKGIMALITFSFMIYFNFGKMDSQEQLQKAYIDIKKEINLRKDQNK
ncbi:MAG: hypothetical protein ACFFCI_06960 [Promethearchaeota archaeon]